VIAALVRWLDLKRSLIVFVVIGIVVVAVHMRIGSIRPTSSPAASAIYAMGFTTMFTEILIILVFQAISGYIYTRIAAIVAAFMLGMGLASSLMGRRFEERPALRNLVAPQVGLTVMPAVVIAGLKLLKPLSASLSHTAVDITFILTALVTGGLGGTVFAAASGMLVRRQPSVADAGALAYSLDLTGACVAGFMTGFLIIPSLGFETAAYSVCIFGLVGLIPSTISRLVLRAAPSR
jgi:predicted membrane-bound spermidine synthase